MHGKNVANIPISDGTARENGIIRMALFGQSACETLAGNVNNTRNRQFPMRLYETSRWERVAKLRKERNEDNIKRTPSIEWHDDQNRYAIIIKTWAIWGKEKFKMRTRKYEASRRRGTERGAAKEKTKKEQSRKWGGWSTSVSRDRRTLKKRNERKERCEEDRGEREEKARETRPEKRKCAGMLHENSTVAP